MLPFKKKVVFLHCQVEGTTEPRRRRRNEEFFDILEEKREKPLERLVAVRLSM